ncbi:ABC transporter ATP-binding protein [Halopenitus sp. H-Gu1]|uniref:ABC transporter ATP-binding protein n=1 Tax=Halopenitus sp. H-Gu1 TaxID=3242697 RepID=UPI00359E4C4B
MNDERPLLRVENVTRTYGGIPVLSDVSLDVHPGITAVIGPNGSGKSTLLRTIVGETAPIDGTITHLGPDADRPIGHLPQRVPFRDGFTARETLAFYARLVGDDPEKHLERVGLADAGDRRVEALSGGMRRLLGIAQATIGDPPVIVLDEPTSGLDPGMRERAFELAADHADSDTAIVMSSHDLELVDRYADRIVCLVHGSIGAAGSIRDLRESYDVETIDELYRSVVHGDANGDQREPKRAVHITGVSSP